MLDFLLDLKSGERMRMDRGKGGEHYKASDWEIVFVGTGLVGEICLWASGKSREAYKWTLRCAILECV